MQPHTLTAANNSTLTIHPFGAHITSWRPHAKEQLYTSPTAVYDFSRAIRGGIPICFPQFADQGPLPKHGFARTTHWKIDQSQPADASSVRLELSDSNDTRDIWPHYFVASLLVALSDCGNSVSITFSVKNRNEHAAFSFTTALHTYFACDVERVSLKEYAGCTYADSTDGGNNKMQTGGISFDREIDRVLYDTPDLLRSPNGDVVIEKVNLPDAVVWNPACEKTKCMSDLPDEDWRRFVCIEPARVKEAVHLEAGDTWTCSVTMSVKK